MPSSKDPIPIHFPHPRGRPPPHQLEAEDALIAEGFSPCTTTYQRNAYLLNDAFACDAFRMYDYKVRRCMRGKSHDWTNCPFAHRGEKARRRDPRKIHYSGQPCPDFRKGSCRRGDACVYAHGVFECWLHPARYRTQPCKDGKDCKRKVCFFAHSMQQLRHVAAPVEESLVDGEPIMDLHTHELYSHVQESGFPVGMGSMEEFFIEKASRMDSYEQYEVGMALPTNTSALSSGDVYNAHMGSVSGTLSMLTWSSPTQNLSSSPYEPISSIGFSLNHPTGVPLEVFPPSNLFTVAPGPPSSEMGAISKNSPLFEQSIAPAIFSSGSPSQQPAARQAFLIHERYGKGGETILNVSADELSDMVHYGGYGDTAHGFMNASRRGGSDADEVATELSGTPKLICSTDQLALLGQDLSSYNSSGSYGLSSPTSTLAGPFYISSFSSPPLSPLNTPSSDTSNTFSSRGPGNLQVDDRIPKADAHILSRHCGKELESKHVSTDQEFLHANHHSQLVGYGDLSQCLELPLFSQRTSGQNKWIPLCKNWNAEGTYKRDIIPDNMRQKFCDKSGEEGPAENAMPDLGWVCELVM